MIKTNNAHDLNINIWRLDKETKVKWFNCTGMERILRLCCIDQS